MHLALWAEAFSEAIRAISEKTGTSKGDRTMLDSLIAAYETLVESMEKNKSDLESIGEAVSAAEKKAIETKSMNFKFDQGFQSRQVKYNNFFNRKIISFKIFIIFSFFSNYRNLNIRTLALML